MKYQQPRIVASKKHGPPLSSSYCPPPVKTGRKRVAIEKQGQVKVSQAANQTSSVEVRKAIVYASN
jgi:hypothetical protein